MQKLSQIISKNKLPKETINPNISFINQINKTNKQNFSSKKIQTKKINNMSEILPKYNNFIFDMDGIIWKGSQYINKTINFIKHLQSNNKKKVFFLTNTTLSTREDLQIKLKKGNLEIPNPNTIYTSSYLLASYLNTEHKDIKSIYVIGRKGILEELRNFNIEVFGGFEDDFKKLRLYDCDKVEINPNIDAVAVAFDDEINYYKMFYASQIINKTGKFFGTNLDKNLVIGGRRVPAGYSIISALETATETKAHIISKPDPRSLKLIFENHQIDYNEENLKETLMIGDNLSTDIKFANNAGIDSLLSLTGVTKEEEFSNIDYEKIFDEGNGNKNGIRGIGKPTYYIEEIRI